MALHQIESIKSFEELSIIIKRMKREYHSRDKEHSRPVHNETFDEELFQKMLDQVDREFGKYSSR